MVKERDQAQPWAGRFAADLADEVLAYSESLSVDSRMLEQDLWGSEAHAIMLARQGLLSAEDLKALLSALSQAREAYRTGEWELDPRWEDVHMNVEKFIAQEGRAGPEAGGKLHTARSRNDQVLVDARLYVREQILTTEERLLDLQGTLLDIAAEHVRTIMPGYTHTQHAQPITLGFWASAYASLWQRDLRRLKNAYGLVNTNPLGACALAGTSFPIDRLLTARLLGFDGVHEHALDLISARDFIAEPLAALAILMAHLSKLSEEIVWWSTYEFGFVEVADAYATGSSIMPQKKNPCVAELTRGKTGQVFGRLMQLLTTMKGLPLGYNRDLQEDKPPLWEAFDTVQLALVTLNGMMRTLTFNTERMAELADANFATATELANYLVREHHLPFRRGHEIVGQTVSQLIAEGKNLTHRARVRELLAEQGIDAPEEALRDVLDPVRCVEAYQSLGSTSPAEVLRMIADLRAQREAHAADVAARRGKIERARQWTQEMIAGVLEGRKVQDLLAGR